MKNFLLFLTIFFFCSCASTKPTIVQSTQEKTTIIRDSVIVRDSIVITPIERIVDIVPQYDTLHLQTSLAKSMAWVDTTTHSLRGEITNKKQTQNKNRIEVKYIYRTDSIFIEKPVPYPEPVKYVPKIYHISMYFSIGVLLFIGLKIYLKFKGM